MAAPFRMTAKPLFKPTQITGCQLWLDAADSSTFTFSSGTNVSAWRDKAVANNATANTAIVYNANGLGTGFPALTFTSSQWLDGSISITGTTMTVFSIFSMNSASPFAARVIALAASEVNDFNNTGYVGILRQSSTNMGPYRNGTYTQAVTPYSTRLMNTTYFDGTNQYTTTNGGTLSSNASTGSFTVSAYRIANNTNSGDTAAAALNGFIGEILVYNRSLTLAQRQQVEGYLAWKWGLVVNLPADHPYKTTPVISSFPFPSVISPSILTVAIPNAATNRAVFTPRQISGCQLLLDGVDPNGTGVLPITGSTVSIWNDKSGNARNVTGSGTPTFLSGGGINFNGTNAFYTNTNFAYNLSTRSVFLVAKVNTYKQYAGLITFIPNPTSDVDQNSITGMSVETAANTSLSFNQYLGGPAPVYMSILTASLTNVNLYNDNMNGTIGTGFVNGNTITNITTATIAGTTSGFGVGTRWQGSMSLSYLFTGAIYEIILYSGPLSTTQRQQVEGYLAWKWGLISSLPNGHPYKQPPIAPFPYAVRRVVQGSSVSSFSPRSVSGLSLWLDAADPNGSGAVPADASAISTWYDKSGNNRTLITTTAGTGSVRYSTYGGIGSILFNSTSPNTAYMRVVSPVNLTNFSVFVVSRCQGVRSNQNALLAVPLTQHEYNSTDGFGMFIDSDSGSQTDRFYGTTNPNVVLNSNPSGVDAYPLRSMCWTSTENGTLRSWFNGNTGNTNSVGVSRTSTATGFGIGFDILGASGTPVNLTCISQFSECIVYSTTLTDSARQQVEGYLAWKWGLVASLPANHPYKLIPPK